MHYAGLNKESNLLGKINPICVLSYIYQALRLKTTQIWFLTQCAYCHLLSFICEHSCESNHVDLCHSGFCK